jgi:hypothetical protein
VDDEKKFVIGFENKVDKTNKVLSKHESDQCSGHLNWLNENYPEYTKLLFVVGDLEGYNNLATPSPDLNHIYIQDIQRISDLMPSIHAKKILPEQLDPSLDTQNLRMDTLFELKKVSALPRV